MNKKNQEQEIPNVEFNKSNHLNDYKYLIKKLKSIKGLIDSLEKKFFEKEI